MSSADRLKREKRALRREVLARRDALPPDELERRSAEVARRLLGLPELAAAGTVMAFSSFGSEVRTTPILDGLVARGRRAVLPRIVGGELEPVVFRPDGDFRTASFGAREPVGGEVLPAAEIDVVVTPGVAFDRRGHRVGYGAGYYDRFFRRTRPDVVKVAIGFALQLIDGVPHGSADVPVDVVVTDEVVVRCR
ncbi:MAG: 5-formyltetrahydrofolate cyclo-ligase [Candidatus Velamenicoccus archaeovorus]